MWWTAFLTGLGVSLLLGIGGAGLMLRGSVWQALAVSQWSAVGGVLASIIAWPVMTVAALTAGLSLVIVQVKRNSEQWPLGLFLVGSATVLLLAGNFAQAELSAASWAEGQLYFVTSTLALSAALITGSALLTLPFFFQQWLRLQAQPDQGTFPKPNGWRLIAEAVWWTAIIVLATATVGSIATLAFLLFPAWIAALVSRNAVQFVCFAALFSVLGYLIAWTLALVLDQPFAPVLILTLCLLSSFVASARALVSYRSLRRFALGQTSKGSPQS